MYCGESQPPRVKPKKKVTKVRRVFLPSIQEEDPNTGLVTVRSQERDEIVEQLLVCSFCSEILGDPEVVEEIDLEAVLYEKDCHGLG